MNITATRYKNKYTGKYYWNAECNNKNITIITVGDTKREALDNLLERTTDESNNV